MCNLFLTNHNLILLRGLSNRIQYNEAYFPLVITYLFVNRFARIMYDENYWVFYFFALSFRYLILGEKTQFQ